MKAVVQRVSRASVEVQGHVVGAIEKGFLVLLGVGQGDTEETAAKVARKVAALRIFEDGEGKMNRSLAETGGAVLCISQFTLLADVRRGNRPSFTGAADQGVARPLYETFCNELGAMGLRCEMGVFGADMQVSLVNDGPVTLIIDSAELDRPRG